MGCEDTESSFRPRYDDRRKLAHFSVCSAQYGEFSVFSPAVQNFATAC